MAENKTKPTDASVEDYIASRANEEQRADCKALMSIFKRITKQQPKMWGPSIVGYGSYRYTYESGRRGEMCSPRRERARSATETDASVWHKQRHIDNEFSPAYGKARKASSIQSLPHHTSRTRKTCLQLAAQTPQMTRHQRQPRIIVLDRKSNQRVERPINSNQRHLSRHERVGELVLITTRGGGTAEHGAKDFDGDERIEPRDTSNGVGPDPWCTIANG
jgi:hypothetical protein